MFKLLCHISALNRELHYSADIGDLEPEECAPVPTLRFFFDTSNNDIKTTLNQGGLLLLLFENHDEMLRPECFILVSQTVLPKISVPKKAANMSITANMLFL